MGASNLVVYVPPLLFNIVAVTFFCLWRAGLTPSWHWAAGFAQTALGFVLSTFSLHALFDAFSSGMVFIGAAYCYGSGLMIHFGARRHRVARRGLVVVYTPILAYLVFIEQSLVWQLFLTDAAFAVLLGIAVVTVVPRASRRIDIGLVAASTVVVFDSVLRTTFFTFFTESSDQLGDFANSGYNLAVHISTITVCMIFPFTALGAIVSKAIERHRNDAEKDHLTGLANRRGFEKAIERTFGSGTPSGTALVFDIDHFKQVNDTFGHATGDRTIVLLAEVLRQTVGASGHIARTGGEEFVAYLPSASPSDGLAVGNLVRVSFEHADWARLGMDRAVTVSAGAAPVTEGPQALDTAFDLADRALYAAKSTGRNKVVSSEHSALADAATQNIISAIPAPRLAASS
ncbi:hypothetical protein ASG25_19930 [Rhizobium sp. Leaf384]|uniref:GGDEF domain-containing protein n=1 Tax=unclassified Rhizobium TaxID=2613769 RepID=UPI000714A317|nr:MULTISPECIES: GGDEF domain-containing protein [unclassified Rhizobium]KQS75625.1 hypothetical protein ASG25_19930 [Rhizobium sp. Leaf384]KQS75874.1 hypothetical protein ASG58_13610 [Rhizobium sp. Leaf383]